jgi:hypothetical protein
MTAKTGNDNSYGYTNGYGYGCDYGYTNGYVCGCGKQHYNHGQSEKRPESAIVSGLTVLDFRFRENGPP